MGMTAKADDLRACASRPRPIALNLVGCFLLVPLVATGLARLLGLPQSCLVGLTVLACVNGGTASNVLTLLAGGDVALSVMMTTTTTIGAMVATPAAAKLLLGAVVPVDTFGIVCSAVLVVLIPTGLGVASCAAWPTFCEVLGPWIPQIAVLFAVPIVGGTVASSAEQVWDGDIGLHVAVMGMLLLSTLLAYALSWATGGREKERRAMAMEFAVKNVVFASVLLRDHFEDQATQVPVAAYAFWASLFAGGLAACWGRCPVPERKADPGGGAWVAEYRA